METNRIIHGDAFDVLADMDPESVHAVVTDPPYGLAFMGRDWDDFEPKEYQAWCEEWATPALDILKPGGHLLAFSGNRTHHRLFSGVEDAGFEIRDTLTWHYGSGFPKALDVSKAIDKAEGEEREILGPKKLPDGRTRLENRVIENEAENRHEGYDREWRHDEREVEKRHMKTAPATDAARKWGGWKTALKPATEFIVLARKPFDGTVAENVQAHGTGALNIDGCQIEAEGGFGWDKTDIPERTNRPKRDSRDEPDGRSMARHSDGDGKRVEPEGRYPANVIFDAEAAAQLDREVGETSDGGNAGNGYEWKGSHAMRDGMSGGASSYTDTGGPSRYFYTSKATRAERTLDGRIDNAHPTVKPVDLMEWLVRLVTAEDQTILDPFAGTGTTCKAAKDLGRAFIGVEKQAKWADVARVRCGLTPEDPSHIRADDAQHGLEAFE